MQNRLRQYKCSLCKRTICRKSNKQWIKSMCELSGNRMGRLILIKKKRKEKES